MYWRAQLFSLSTCAFSVISHFHLLFLSFCHAHSFFFFFFLFFFNVVPSSVHFHVAGPDKWIRGPWQVIAVVQHVQEYRGKGNSAKGKEEQKPVTTVALDRVCVRVWRRHVWPCMCACICQENVYVKEKMCMHTAVRCWQLSKNKTMPWLNYGGGGGDFARWRV